MLSAAQVKKIRNTLFKSHDERLTVIFNALGDPCRFFIFHLLLMHYAMCVTDVANICRISIAGASQQLKVLELSGIVVKKRMGQTVCYSLKEKDPFIKKIVKIVSRRPQRSGG